MTTTTPTPPEAGAVRARPAWIAVPSGRRFDTTILVEDAEVLALLLPRERSPELVLSAPVEIGELVEGVPSVACGHVVPAPRGSDIENALWVALSEPFARRQRRCEFRIPENLAGRVRPAERRSWAGTPCRVVDLSAGGARLSGDIVLPEGTEAHVTIEIPGEAEIEAVGRVVRVMGENGSSQRQIGIRFHEIDGRGEGVLRRYIARRQRERAKG